MVFDLESLEKFRYKPWRLRTWFFYARDFPMRSFGVLAGLVVAMAALSAAAEEFPYQAHVQADDVYVRSGPGRGYYPTDKLHKGDAVEVYRHDPGGWYAIRPPEGSFSWVSARYLEVAGDGLGVITGEDVVARVGSSFSDIRDVIQVRLKPKERVAIIGEHDGGGQKWYKIAPPSGEFRWISADYLDRTSPPNGVGKPRRRPKTYFAQQQAEQNPPTVALASHDDPFEPAGTREPAPLSAEEQEPRPIANRLIREIEAERAAAQTGVGAAGETNETAIAPASYEARLKAIDLELATMAAEEPTVWAFDGLKRELETLLAHAATAIQRGEARKLQHQIARLEDIQTRYRQIGSVLDATERRNAAIERQLAPLGAVTPASATMTKFDGEGVLRPVVSRRKDAPRYALVDERDAVLFFLTPAPGLNLQSYFGERIGVYGTRGFLPGLRKSHIMVRRVELLDKFARPR
jgi:SH3-like domain-containing protein